jgi:predicted transcriptional regulator
MKRKIKEQKEAREMRSQGYSLKQISKIIGVSKGSVSVWTRDIDLTKEQKTKLNICEKQIREDRFCKFCNNKIDSKKTKNVFCDFNCRIKFFEKKRKETQNNKCKFCGNPARFSFCSEKCCVDYNWSIKIEKAEKTGMAPSCQNSAKALIKKTRENKCVICNNDMWLGAPIPLVLDHVNGNHDDWRLENLRLVCGNCNMRLPTFTSKNSKKNRLKQDSKNIYRREYYQSKIEKE